MNRASAELLRPCFTAGTSRVARSRAAKALGRKRKPVAPQSPPSPNQESAINPLTGKVAFGPWQGPFAAHPDSGAPLFSDRAGNTYASLSSVKQPVSATTTGPPAPEPAAAATRQLYALMDKVLGRRAEAAAQGRQPASQWPQKGGLRGSGRSGRTMGRAINQPRRC